LRGLDRYIAPLATIGIIVSVSISDLNSDHTNIFQLVANKWAFATVVELGPIYPIDP
jgi:hypothetical protein